MKTLKELSTISKIRKLEEIYFETLDDITGKMLDFAIAEYEEKYKKKYIVYR